MTSVPTESILKLYNAITNKFNALITTHNNNNNAHNLSDYIKKNNTNGLLKNDGTVDTSIYLTQHQSITGKADKTNGASQITDSNATNYTNIGTLSSSSTQADINAAVNTKLATTGGTTDFLDKVYPVGSIYLSVNSVDPGDLFGGTWTQLQDTFLLAAGETYDAGDTGGSANAVVVSHSHSQSSHSHTQDSHTHTQASHSHTQNSHTHTLGSHTHTQAEHTHSAGSHTHTQGAHTHTQDAHSHTQDAHSHTQDEHNHEIGALKRYPGNGNGAAAVGYGNGQDVSYHTSKATPAISSAQPAISSATPTINSATPTINAATVSIGSATPTINAATPTISSETPGIGSATPTINAAQPGISSSTSTIYSSGESGTGKNMPPYLAVYMWQRIE